MIVLAALRTELLFVRGPRACVGLAASRWSEVAVRLRGRRPVAALVVGFAGGLRAELQPGTLVVASEVQGEGGLCALPALVDLARTALPEALVGPVHTTAELAALADKARLGVDALAVDMETAWVARALEEMEIPWLAVRVILDALWESLPQGRAHLRWAPRAVSCARRLGDAWRRVGPQLAEVVA